jgi:hypothetical protein
MINTRRRCVACKNHVRQLKVKVMLQGQMSKFLLSGLYLPHLLSDFKITLHKWSTRESGVSRARTMSVSLRSRSCFKAKGQNFLCPSYIFLIYQQILKYICTNDQHEKAVCRVQEPCPSVKGQGHASRSIAKISLVLAISSSFTNRF